MTRSNMNDADEKGPRDQEKVEHDRRVLALSSVYRSSRPPRTSPPLERKTAEKFGRGERALPLGLERQEPHGAPAARDEDRVPLRLENGARRRRPRNEVRGSAS